MNFNDKKLLKFCSEHEKTTRQIAEHLNIAVKNVFVRLEKLEKQNLIQVRRKGKGKKTYIRSVAGIKIKEYMIEALKVLKVRKEMTPLEFAQIFPFNPFEENNDSKQSALFFLKECAPSLIDIKIKINEEGNNFITNNSQKNPGGSKTF